MCERASVTVAGAVGAWVMTSGTLYDNNWSPMPRRISIQSLCLLVALLAVDSAWYRRAFHEHRSAFGFGNAPAFDTGVIPMANILVIGMYLVVARKVRAGPFLIGFEIVGLFAIGAFIAMGWTWPDGVRHWVHPIYPVWSSFSSGPLPHIYMLVGDMACILPVQVLLATGGGLLARLFLGHVKRIG
jgi:hypothetical protein